MVNNGSPKPGLQVRLWAALQGTIRHLATPSDEFVWLVHVGGATEFSRCAKLFHIGCGIFVLL